MSHANIKSLAVIGIIFFAAFLRLYGISRESAWWDEIVTLDALREPGLVSFLQHERAEDPPMTPVYFTAAWYWSRVGGDSVLWMRLLSVGLGLGCIPVLYGLGRRLVGTKGAVLASLAFAASLVHVYYAQEIRVYSLTTLLALCSMYCFVRWLEDGGKRWGWFGGHVVVNGLLAFTHLFGVLLFAVQGVFLLLAKKWGRSPIFVANIAQRNGPDSENRGASPFFLWLIPHTLIGGALAAWLSTIDTSTIHEAASWMVPPGWREVAMMAVLFAGGRPTNENPALHLPGGMSFDLVLTGMVGLMAAVYAARRLWPREQRATDCGPVLLLLIWLILPVVTLFAASYVWRPCFVYRYILYASIPLYLLLGAAVAELRWGRVAGAALAVVWSYQLLAVACGPVRPDWRSAGAWLETHMAPADTVVALQGINEVALRYNSSIPQTRVRRTDVWSGIGPAVQQVHSSGGDAWVVVWLWTEPGNIEGALRDGGLGFTRRKFAGWPGLQIYHVPRPQPQQ